MFPLVNDCVVIPAKPNWVKQPEWSRQWSTQISEGVRGQEDRSNSRSVAYQRIQYSILAGTLQEHREMVARILQGLKKGRVAVPFWARQQYFVGGYPYPYILADPREIFTSGKWRWETGQYAYFRNRAGQWEIAELVAGTTWDVLYLANALVNTYETGDLVVPVLFGTLTIDNKSLLSDHLSDVILTVQEPAGAAPEITLGTCSEQPPVLFGNSVATCAGKISLTLVDNDTCPKSYKLTWTQDQYADSYEIEHRDVGGSWSLLATTTQFEFQTVRPYRVDKEFRVRSMVGETAGDWAAEVLVSAITIEAVMRAVQERKYVTDQVLVEWPDSAPDYPPDGYYDEAITSEGATKEVELIQAIADVFNDNSFLAYYCTQDTLEGVSAASGVPVYSKSVAPFTAIPMTVTELLRDQQLRQLALLCCALKTVKAQTILTDFEARYGEKALQTTYGLAIGGASEAYSDPENEWAGDSGDVPKVLTTHHEDPSGYHFGQFDSKRGRYWADLQYTGSKGIAKLFLAVGIPVSIAPEVSYQPGNFPPVQADGDFHLSQQAALPQTTIYSAMLGDMKGSAPDVQQTYGWELHAAQWIVTKSDKPSSTNWTYYP